MKNFKWLYHLKVLCEKMFTDLNVVHCIHVLQHTYIPMNMYNFCLNNGYLNETEYAELKSKLVPWEKENTRFSLIL